MTFSEKLADIVRRGRGIIIGVLIGVVVAVAATFIVLEVQRARNQSALMAVEQVEAAYEQLQILGNDEREDQDAADELPLMIADILERYPRHYVSARALFIRSDYYWNRSEWNQSAEDCLMVADRFSNSHLAPICLYNAATAYEAGGVPQQAISILERLVSEYSDQQDALIPRALFALGRLHEKSSAVQQSGGYYNRLIEDYPQSRWADLAQNRIIDLVSRGLLEE